MKTKRAAAFLLCVCLILCLLPSLSASRAFDGVAFLVVNNTLLRPLTAETMPVFLGKEVFVPYSVLDRLNSVKYKYEPQREKLTLYNEEGFLVFDLAGGRTYDETGAEYEFDAAYVNNTVYIPVDTTCEKFGLYHSVSILSLLAPMVRIHEGELIGSDIDFTARLYTLFSTTYEEFADSNSLPVSPEPYTPAQRAAYLAFYGDPAQAEDLPEKLKMPACFLLTAEEITEGGGFVRRCAAEGHSIGFMLDPDGDSSLSAQYQAALDALRLRTGLISRIVSVKGGSSNLSDSQTEELVQLGVNLWDITDVSQEDWERSDGDIPVYGFAIDTQSAQNASDFVDRGGFVVSLICDWTPGLNEMGIY